MEQAIARSKKKVAHWTKADWENSGRGFSEICKDLAALRIRQLPADSPEAQAVIRRHYQWLQQFWKPTAESYSGHSQLIVDSELRKAYEAFDPPLPEFAAAAMKVFAHRELT